MMMGVTGGGGGKPAKLSSSASYTQAVAKINEIITYCNAHPGNLNDYIKSFAQTFTSDVSQSDWDNSSQDYKIFLILQINSMIADLE
jgi:hypothetical protein